MIRVLEQVLEPSQQERPLGRDEMVKNPAGGYVFEVTDQVKLDRFLMLGTANGTFYAEERELTESRARCVVRLAKQDGKATVERIVEISLDGRAPKNDYALFALAICVAHGNDATQRLALENLPRVARIGTHLFQFFNYLRKMRGLGRRVKTAIARWYLDKDADRLAYQLVKYRNRYGWTHRDIFRLVRPKISPQLPHFDNIRWAVKGEVSDLASGLIQNFAKLQDAKSTKEVRDLLEREPLLTHEMIPTEFKDASVWRTLLDRTGKGRMPLGALLRNLPTLTRLKVLRPFSSRTEGVLERLTNHEDLKRARIHPIQMLVALKTYNHGRSIRGSAKWTPVQEVTDALGKGMSLAFRSLPHIPRDIYLGVDVSGSMGWKNLMDVPGFSPRVAAAALSVCLAKQCRRSVIFGFSRSMVELKINSQSTIISALGATSNLPFGGTDCAAPMLHAMDTGIKAHSFIILTDSVTWAGGTHPFQALKKYRQKVGIPAKLAVVGLDGDDFSIADPMDAGMMDFVGFDANLPQVLSEFLLS